jgi:hypothetical protein
VAAVSYELIFPERESGQDYDSRDFLRLFGWATAVWAVANDLAGCVSGAPSVLGRQLLAIDAARDELEQTRWRAERDAPAGVDPESSCDLTTHGALRQRVQVAADRYTSTIERYHQLLQQPTWAAPLKVTGLRMTAPLVVTLSTEVVPGGRSQTAVLLAIWAVRNGAPVAHQPRSGSVLSLGHRLSSASYDLLVEHRLDTRLTRGQAERRAEQELDRLARTRPVDQSPIVLETTALLAQ